MDPSQPVDRWASLLDQQADTVLVVSPTGEILHATSSVERLLGGTGDRMKGTALADLARPDERAAMLRMLAECLAHRGEPLASTLQFLDVERRWVSCDIQAVAPSAGEDPVVIWSLRECTSRIVRENRDAERAAHWQAMINAQPAGIILVDDDRIIREANPAARRMLRLTAGPLGRDELDRFFDPADDVAAAWGTFIGDGSFQGRLRIRTAGDGEREFEALGRANVLPGRHLGVFRDVTDGQVLERQLRRESNLEVASRIAGAIADEFDDILDCGIRNLDDLAVSLGESDPSRRVLNEVRPAVIRASNLTRNLLAFSQRQILRTQAVDLLQAVLRLKPMVTR
ncbi:MAG: PAS domain-containing protein, partial [Gemmatimonadales bacterium]